jgi:hypothetical protein
MRLAGRNDCRADVYTYTHCGSMASCVCMLHYVLIPRIHTLDVTSKTKERAAHQLSVCISVTDSVEHGSAALFQCTLKHMCAMLCHAVPCCAMLCHAVPCCAMLCHAVPCCAMLCHAVPCCAMLCSQCRRSSIRLAAVSLRKSSASCCTGGDEGSPVASAAPCDVLPPPLAPALAACAFRVRSANR